MLHPLTADQLIEELGLRYVDRYEAAELLGISLSTLDRLDGDEMEERTFPQSRRLGGRRKWLIRDLLVWAEAQ